MFKVENEGDNGKIESKGNKRQPAGIWKVIFRKNRDIWKAIKRYTFAWLWLDEWMMPLQAQSSAEFSGELGKRGVIILRI